MEISLQKVGVIYPWPNQQDSGRAEVTHLELDRMVFKVPSLKNIAETGPYFHDGSISDLQTAIRMMALHQLGIENRRRRGVRHRGLDAVDDRRAGPGLRRCS